MAVACGSDGCCSSPQCSASCADAGLIHAMNDTNEQMILSFDSLIRGQAEVSIAFGYSLRPGLEGLYRSQITGDATAAVHPHLLFVSSASTATVHQCLSTTHISAGNVGGTKGGGGGRGIMHGSDGLLDAV